MSKVKPSLAEILNLKKNIKLPKEQKDKRLSKNVIIDEENNNEEIYDKNSSTLEINENKEIKNEEKQDMNIQNNYDNEEKQDMNEKEIRRIKLMKKLEKLEKNEPDTEDEEQEKRDREEKRPRRRSRSPRKDDRLVRDENIFKAGLNDMLKNNSESFGNDCIDLLREILKDIMKNIFVNLDDDKLTQSYISDYMKKFFKEKDFEKDIDVCISPVVFEKKIRELAEEQKCVIRKDSLYMLHTSIEKILINCIKGGEMIANANKRSRLGPKDIGLTYAILML